jgi:hypothetical protein
MATVDDSMRIFINPFRSRQIEFPSSPYQVSHDDSQDLVVISSSVLIINSCNGTFKTSAERLYNMWIYSK